MIVKSGVATPERKLSTRRVPDARFGSRKQRQVKIMYQIAPDIAHPEWIPP
jgi:hypothetical protein